MTPEGKVKKQVKDLLTKYGVYYFMPVANGYTRAGVPDIVACHKGVFIGIECKAGNNKTTKLQDIELKKIVDAGGLAFIVNEENIIYLEQVLKNVSGIKECDSVS